LIRRIAISMLLLAAAACAQPEPQRVVTDNVKPKLLEQVGIDQKLNSQLPLDTVFRDETGAEVKLGQYFGKRPVVLVFVYFNCPMLCPQVLDGVNGALKTLSFTVGKEFDVVAISIDPTDTPPNATDAKRRYVQDYGRPGAEHGWHFLTGEEPSIAAVTKAAGFRYAYDPEIKQYAHAAAIMIVTTDGRIAQYYYGIEFPPNDIRLALVEASHNKIGNIVDELTLFCYHYNPSTGRYGAAIMTILRTAGVLTVVLIGGMIFVLRRREPTNVKGRAA
jgi:protein SCO1